LPTPSASEFGTVCLPSVRVIIFARRLETIVVFDEMQLDIKDSTLRPTGFAIARPEVDDESITKGFDETLDHCGSVRAHFISRLDFLGSEQ
jgi:hypothetical protein